MYNAATSLASSIGLFDDIPTNGPHAKQLMNRIKQMVDTKESEVTNAAISVLRCLRQEDLSNILDRRQALGHVRECLAVLQAFIVSDQATEHVIFLLETLFILSEVVDRLWHNVDVKTLYLTYMNHVWTLLDNSFRGNTTNVDVIFRTGSTDSKEGNPSPSASSLSSNSAVDGWGTNPPGSYAAVVSHGIDRPTAPPRGTSATSKPTNDINISIPVYSGSTAMYVAVCEAAAFTHHDDLYDDIRYFLQMRSKKVGQPESCYGVVSSKYYRRSTWQLHLLLLMIDINLQLTAGAVSNSTGGASRNRASVISKRVEFTTSRVFSNIDNGATKKKFTLSSSVCLGVVWLDCCQDVLALRGISLPVNAISTVCGYITNNASIIQSDYSNQCILAGVAAFGYGIHAGFHRHLLPEVGVGDNGEIVTSPIESIDHDTLAYIRNVDEILSQWVVGAIVRSPSSVSLKTTVAAWQETLRVWTGYISWTGSMYASDYSDGRARSDYPGMHTTTHMRVSRADRFWNFILDRFLALSMRDQASTVLACVVCLAPHSEPFRGKALGKVIDLISSSSIKLSFDMLVVCQITPRSLPAKALHDLVSNRVHALSSASDGRDILVKHNTILKFLDSSAQSVLGDSASRYPDKKDCARHLLSAVSVLISAMSSVLSLLNSRMSGHSSAKAKAALNTTRQDYLLLYLCLPLRLPGLVELITQLSETALQTDWNEVMMRSLETNVNRFVSATLGNMQMDEVRLIQLREEELTWAEKVPRRGSSHTVPLNGLYGVMSTCLCASSLNWARNAHHHSSRGFATRNEAEDISHVMATASRYLPTLRVGGKTQVPLLYVILAGQLLAVVSEFLTDNIFHWPSNIEKLFDICHHITAAGPGGHWNIGTEGENMVLSPMYKTYISQNCQLENLLMDIKTRTYNVIISLTEPIGSHGLSISQLRNFRDCADDTVVGWTHCRLNIAYDSSQANIAAKITLLEKLCSNLRQLFGVVSWLRSINVLSREVTTTIPLKDLETTACTAIVDEFQRVVRLLGFAVVEPHYQLPHTLIALCYFICSGSNLYSAHFRKFINQREDVANCLEMFQGIGGLISAAHESSFGAMRHLLDSDDILLSDFAAGGMEGFMDGLCGRSKEDVLKELKIITDFVEPNAGSVVMIDDIAMKISRVKSAVRLLRIQHVLGSALDACLNPKIGLLRHIQMASGGKSDVQYLLDIRRDLETHGKFTLSHVPNLLRSVDEILQGLEPGHLELLAELNNAHQLLVFLQAERDFEGQLMLHTQEMQGTEIGGKVLTDLAIAHRFLKSLNLTSSTGTGPNWTFAQMVGVLRSTVPTEADADEVLGAISSASEHMAEISLWFSGGSAILNLQKLLSMVKKYMTDGLFVTVFSNDVEKSVLQLRVHRSESRSENIKAEVLVELIRGIVLSRGEAASEEDRSTLDSFLMAYDQAQKTHDIVIQARRNCVPCFHGIKIYEHAAMTDPIGLHTVEADISTWYVIYGQKLKSCPRLHFLTRKQLLKCLHILKSKKCVASLIGYVRLCFPDCEGQVPSILDQLSTILKAEGSLDFVGELTAVYEECLTVFCDALGKCNTTLCAYGLVDSPDDDDPFALPPTPAATPVVTQAKPVVIKAHTAKSYALYGELNSRNKGAPLPSQLLWCTANTTKNEMKDFIARASVWKKVFFAFMNVNLLRVAVRDALLEACLDSSEEGLALHEHIFLFFCGERGLDAFTVLENEVADMEEGGSTGYMRGMDTVAGMSALFPVVSMVSGEACVGKSTLIADAMSALRAEDAGTVCTMLSMHEDLLLGPLVEWYKANASAPKIGIHVNICAHSLYRSVDRIDVEEESAALNDHLLVIAPFFHSLVHCGVLLDDRTGDVTVLSTTAHHHLYVELPSVLMHSSEGLLSTGSNACDKHVYASLLAPVIQARTADFEVTSAKYPFKISNEARLVALYLDHYRNNKLGGMVALPTLETVTAAALSDADARQVLEGVWSRENFPVPSTNRRKEMFVQLMLERVKFLADYVAFYKMESQYSGQEGAMATARTLAHDCITVFIREVTAICCELSGDWSKANCAYTVRYMTREGATAARIGMTCLCNDRYIHSFPIGMGDTVLSIDNACDNPRLWGTLRSEVALAYGMDDTNRVLTLLQSQNYILTPDFAVKLLVLRDLHSCGIPAILQGSTGTGKTEQIQILSLLLNNRSDIMPNMVEKTYELLSRLVADGILSPAKESHRVFFDDNGNLLTSRKYTFDVRCICEECMLCVCMIVYCTL